MNVAVIKGNVYAPIPETSVRRVTDVVGDYVYFDEISHKICGNEVKYEMSAMVASVADFEFGNRLSPKWIWDNAVSLFNAYLRRPVSDAVFNDTSVWKTLVEFE